MGEEDDNNGQTGHMGFWDNSGQASYPQGNQASQVYGAQQKMNSFGKYGNAIVGAGLLASNAVGMANQAYSINTKAPGADTDAYGRPSYNLGQFAAETAGIKPKGASAGEIGSGALEGAAIGTKILPGWGTVAGAAIGGIVSAIGGGARKRRQAKRKRLAMGSLFAAQNLYNASETQANNQQYARDQYNHLNNDYDRTNNIYNANMVS